MISMTTYWQQLQDSLNQLPHPVTEKLDPQIIQTATSMVEIGESIERMVLTKIKGVSNSLHEASKNFNNLITYDYQGKSYSYYLPKVTDRASLIFAILYYQHLRNYAQVEYQGVINWFRSMVVEGIETKKPTTKIQALAMLSQIKSYSQSQSIELIDEQLLKQDNEPIKDYVQRVLTMLPIEPPSNALSKLNQPDEVTQWQQSLSALNEKMRLTIDKIYRLTGKLSAFHLSMQQSQEKHKQWQKQGLFSRFFYWLIQWVYVSPLAKQIEEAEKTCQQADEDLRQELGEQTNSGLYLLTLYQQAEQISREQTGIRQKIEQSQIKQQPQLELVPKEEILVTSKELEKLTKDVATMTLSDCTHFFAKNLPSRKTMELIAVGLGAIAIRNINGF
jgi:hypothetical protein